MSTSDVCSLEELNIELDAMQTIARALAAVGDPEIRSRILRWTNERFGSRPAGPPSATKEVRPLASDPALSVEGLQLFEEQHEAVPVAEAARPPAAAAQQPLDALVR